MGHTIPPIWRETDTRLRLEGGECPACHAQMVDMRFGKGGACNNCGSALVRDVEGRPNFVILGSSYKEMLVARKPAIPVAEVLNIKQNA